MKHKYKWYKRLLAFFFALVMTVSLGIGYSLPASAGEMPDSTEQTELPISQSERGGAKSDSAGLSVNQEFESEPLESQKPGSESQESQELEGESYGNQNPESEILEGQEPESGAVVFGANENAYEFSDACGVNLFSSGEEDVPNASTGQLRIVKKDYLTGNLLNEAKFRVYKQLEAPDEGNLPKDAVKVKEGTWVVPVDNASPDGSGILETGANDNEGGIALSAELEPGTYYIYETIKPDDYLSWTDGGTANNQWHPYNGPWSGPHVVKAGEITEVEFVNYQVTSLGRIYDNDTKTGVKEAWLVAFETEEDAKQFKEYRDSLNIVGVTINSNAKADLIKSLKQDPEFLEKYKIKETAESVANGNFHFTSLQPDKKYYIVNAVPPDGYRLSDEIYEWGVTEVGFDSTEAQIYLAPMGRISVEMSTSLSGIDYPVPGIGFNIYQYKDGQDTYRKASEASVELPVTSGTTGDDGIYTSAFLMPGTYIVKEDISSITDDSIVKMPEGAAPYKVIEVKEGSKPSDGSDAEFKNEASCGKFILKVTDQKDRPIQADFRLDKKTEDGKWEPAKDSKGNTVDFTTPTEGIYESDFLKPGTYRLVETAADGYTVAYGEENPVEFCIKDGEILGSTEQAIKPGELPKIEEVTSLNQPILLVNNEQGAITLKKVGNFREEILDDDLQGVTFVLYQYVGQGEPGESVDLENENWRQLYRSTTDENGKITWNKLDAGWYYLIESAIESGTEGDGKYSVGTSPVLVEITPGEDVYFTEASDEDANKKNTEAQGEGKEETYKLRFANPTTYGRFQIRCVNSDDNTKGISPAVFEIYTDKECTVRAIDFSGEAASLTTGEDGKGVSPLLPAGEEGKDYYLKQVSVPSGYVALQKITVPYRTIANQLADYSADSYVELWVENVPLSLSFTAESLDTEYTGSPVENPKVQVTPENLEVTFTWEKKNSEGSWDPLAEAPTDAGDYQVTASLKDVQGITASKEFSITKAANTWTVPLSISGWTSGQQPNAPSAQAKFGNVEFTYSDAAAGTYTENVPTSVGTWYVKASVAGTDNYEGLVSAPVSFRISSPYYPPISTPTPAPDQIQDSNGTIIKKDGTIILPGEDLESIEDDTWIEKGDGQEAPVYLPDTVSVVTKEGNKVTLPSGAVVEPEAGSQVAKDGTITEPDGTVIRPDGTIYNTDGSVQSADGTYLTPAAPMLESAEVHAAGNQVKAVLTGESAGAEGYDYVISENINCIYEKDYLLVSKNIEDIETCFRYVPEGTYYVYCHAWLKDENGKKVFGGWSNYRTVEVTAVTPETPRIQTVKVNQRAKTITLTYTRCGDAAGYDIILGRRVEKVNGENRPVDYGKRVKKITNGNTVTVTLKNAKKGTYYMALHAWNRTSEDRTKVFSPWSNIKKIVIR